MQYRSTDFDDGSDRAGAITASRVQTKTAGRDRSRRREQAQRDLRAVDLEEQRVV